MHKSVKCKPGDWLVCTFAETLFFTRDKAYKVYQDDAGDTFIVGNDGYKDYTSLVTSKFKNVGKRMPKEPVVLRVIE